MPAKNIDVSNVFHRNMNCPTRIRGNEGGTGSSKTFSILQLLILYHCFNKTGQVISIVRETLNECKATVMRDFFSILEYYGLYEPKRHNRSEHTYIINGNVVEFFGMDKSHKKRGASRNILYCNEITGLNFEDWFQLMVRTTDEIYFDYNPDIVDHWIFDKLFINMETGEPNPDVTLIHSTYLDNPFLPVARRKAIEDLDKVDRDLAEVYKYGRRMNLKGTILRNVVIMPFDEYPEQFSVHGYGLDFGFTNDVTALVECGLSDGNLHSRQLIYDSGLLPGDIARIMKEKGVNKREEIFADSSNPSAIAEIKSHGFNIVGVDKPRDSIVDGINILKSYKIFTYGKDISDEHRKYKWKKDRATDKFLNEPIDAFNHAIDAERYFAFMKLAHRNLPKRKARPRTI